MINNLIKLNHSTTYNALIISLYGKMFTTNIKTFDYLGKNIHLQRHIKFTLNETSSFSTPSRAFFFDAAE